MKKFKQWLEDYGPITKKWQDVDKKNKEDSEARAKMTPISKQEAYEKGFYKFSPPTGTSTQWDDAGWIKHIDAHGQWTVPIK